MNNDKTNQNYAGYKIRLLAQLLDYVIGLLILSLFFYYITLQPTIAQAVSAAFLSIIILLCPVYLYYQVFLVHYFGGSFGKLLTGLRIINEDGKNLTFKRAFFRQTIGYIFSGIFFGLGFFSIIKDPKKQGWHDKAIGSCVVSKGNWGIVGIMFFIIAIFAVITIFSNAVKQFQKGPLMSEINQVENQIQAENQLPTPSPYPYTNY